MEFADPQEAKLDKGIELIAAERDASGVIGQYQILEQIGAGSLTTVYKVCRPDHEEIYAAKVLRKQYAESPRTSKRFLQEVEKASGLKHENLVSVYDSGKTAEGLPYVICEHINGESLEDRLKSEGPLSTNSVVDLLLELCHGLDAAHQAGLLHRDIKPGNIVFQTTAGKVSAKLADFGIAKVLPGAGRETKYFTPEGEAFGDPSYMSPEQLEGKRLDPRSDIYSLGCVLFECISGTPPFTGKNNVQVAMKQLQEDPDFVSWKSFKVSQTRELERLALGMLSKNPDQRYQNVSDLIADLERIKAGGNVHWQPPPLKFEKPEPVKKDPAKKEPVKIDNVKVEQPRRPELVFRGALVNSSMEMSEASSGDAERFKKNTNHIIEGIPLGKKGTEILLVCIAVLIGLSGAFLMYSIVSGSNLDDTVEWQHKESPPDSPPDPLPQPVPNSTVSSAPQVNDSKTQRPVVYYSPVETERGGQIGMPMRVSLRRRDNSVIFWYNPSRFRDALEEAVSKGVDLSMADLRGQDLSRLNLCNAKLAGADLRRANLEAATMINADLTDALTAEAEMPADPKGEFGGLY